MKYIVGFLLACSLATNYFFWNGYQTYAIKVVKIYSDEKPRLIVFRSFGEPKFITSSPMVDSQYFIITDADEKPHFHYPMFLELDSTQDIELVKK